MLANIHIHDAFLPQILAGTTKKVAAITSGIADIDWINDYDIEELAINAMSKAALNVATAKFNAWYERDGVLFLSVCPGLVDTGHFVERTVDLKLFSLLFPPSSFLLEPQCADLITFYIATLEQQAWLEGVLTRFSKYSPDFNGSITTTESVKAVLSVVENSSIEKGNGGRFLSHFGTKQWL